MSIIEIADVDGEKQFEVLALNDNIYDPFGDKDKLFDRLAV